MIGNSGYKNYGENNVSVSNEWLCFSTYFKDTQKLPNWNRDKFLNGEIIIDKDYFQQNKLNKVLFKRHLYMANCT